MGCGLAKTLYEAGCPIAAAASRSRPSAEALVALVPGCAVADNGQAVAESCDLIFVTTPDGAIEAAARAVIWRTGHAVVHCSGATEIAALQCAADQGADIGGFHPMQSFADPLAAAASLAGCTITIEAEPPLDGTLRALAEALRCRVNRLPPGARALYHAAAGYGSQFVNVLLMEAAALWRRWDAGEEDVVRAFLPMLRGTLDSIESAGIAGGMPGPVSRGDTGSIEGHMAAFRELDAETRAFYVAHCRRTVALARAAGRIDAAAEAELLDVLGVG